MQKWESTMIMHNYWRSYVHQKGRSLHNGLIILNLLSWWPRQWVVTEPACHKCQTLWKFLPRKLTVIVLAHPNSWHHHHPSRCQHLCRHKVGHCLTWGLHELVKRLEFSFGVFGTGICWRTECLSCQAVLRLFKLMGEANANANGLLSTALSLSLSAD